VSRLQTVDSIRVIAIIGVIAIHTRPFHHPSAAFGEQLDLAVVVNQAMRFAVPFFFLISGYFWAKKCEQTQRIIEPTLRMAWRILLIFAVWSFIYLLETGLLGFVRDPAIDPFTRCYHHARDMLRSPLHVLTHGTKAHLWFLSGLLSCLGLVAFMVHFKLERLLVVTIIALYLIALAGKPYADTPLGFHASFNLRNGPFFSTIFFATGYFLQRYRPAPNWVPIGAMLVVAGVALHFAELWALHAYWGTNMNHDFLVGTYLVGTGVGVIALSNPHWLHLRHAAVIGPLILGVYASHYIFVDFLQPIGARFSYGWIWSILLVVLVFVLSSLLARGLAQFSITRKIVM
jgi:surface polysaccharide O-acyltransferase-like enzyme